MACYVTAIAPTESIPELERILGEVPIEHDRLTVITKAEPSDEHERSFLNFIHAGGPRIDSDTFGGLAGNDTAIMTSGGGTGVPGLSASGSGLGYLESSHVVNAIGALPIPEDEADNYNDAIDEGRTVIAYECTDDDRANLEDVFRKAGVQRVRTYRT